MPSTMLLFAAGIFGVIGIVFLISLLWDRDPKRAAERTADKSIGLAAGASGSVIAGLVVGVDAVLQLPELLLTLTGVGAIMAGVEWEIYLAMAAVVYIISLAFESRGEST